VRLARLLLLLTAGVGALLLAGAFGCPARELPRPRRKRDRRPRRVFTEFVRPSRN
jgi:hypothetical protein